MYYVELTWTEQCSTCVPKEFIFDTFVDVYQLYEDGSKNVEDIIDWLTENLKNYIRDFLRLMDIEPSNWNDRTEYDFIDELLSEDMMDEFRKYYKDQYE